MAMFVFWAVVCFATDEGKTSAKGDGFDLFIKALKYQGDNPLLVRSVYLEYSLTERRPTASKELLEKERQKLIEDAQAGIKDDNVRRKYIDHIATRLKEKYGSEHKSKGSYLLKGSRNSNESRRRFVLSQYESGSWSKPTVTLGGVARGKVADSILCDSAIKTIVVSTSNLYSEDFQNFGRVRGLPSVLMTVSLIGSSAPDNFVFSDKSIIDLKNAFDKINSVRGNSILEIMETVKYDGNAEAIVLETKIDNKLVQRYWIDQSRGYVCPLIQIYDPKTGNLMEEYKSDNYFIHKETGLWFPKKHQVVEYDALGQWKVLREYEIDMATFRINHQVSDKEFAVDVSEGYKVMDSRGKKSITYEAVEKGILTLGELGLDEMSWLKKDEIVDEKQISEQSISTIIARLVFLLSGIVLILWSLLNWRKSRQRICIIPFMLITLFPGCSQREEQTQEKITVEPMVVELGRKQSVDSPIHGEFRIHNNTAQPVTITDVISGCGCTVVDFPRVPIIPNTIIAVPFKINLLGRFGDFANKITVRTDTGKTLEVDIKGEIVNAPWSTESSLRCTYENGQPAKCILEVHTVDYPEVQFDLSYINKNITVTEISRSTLDGKTTIKFEVVINTKELLDHNVTLILKPTDSKIVPVTVQVYCFSNEMSTPVPELQTKIIALGIVASKQITVPIYGDEGLLGTIKKAEFIGLPDNVSVEIVPSSDNDILHLTFHLSANEEDVIEGKVRLTAGDKQSWVLPVNGYIANK
jgi:hypothetical protein